MPQRIDAHHHLWHYTPADYPWIGPGMEALQRDFLPHDLVRELAAANLDGAVTVQARQSLAETRWLLTCAAQTPQIRGIVGWVPLISPTIADTLAELATPTLKGVRHVIQDEPDDHFILRPDFNRGIAALLPLNLTYDLLLHPRHLPHAATFVRRHPHQPFILDHLAKPSIRTGELEPWRTDLRALAESENVSAKLSGLVTEADWATVTLAGLRPYLDAALEIFGPHRLMAGSDWPVCLAATPYQRWWSMLHDWAAPLSPDEQAAIFGLTATRIYNLPTD